MNPVYRKFFTEMAGSKASVIELVQNLQDTTNEHIFKLLLFPDAIDAEKWKKEIASKFLKIQLRKSRHNNWYLNKEEYFNILYTVPLDSSSEKNKGDKGTFDIYIINVLQDNDEIISKYNEDTFPFETWNTQIVTFYLKTCLFLSNGKVTRNFIINCINNVLISDKR